MPGSHQTTQILTYCPKKKRGGPYSSGGCVTCRARHLKCDEAKPACLNCTSTAHECGGYVNAKPRRPIRIVLWEPHTPRRRRPVTDLDEQECNAFDFFRGRCAMQLSGSFDSTFWTRTLLQAGHQEPIINTALIALGALSRSIFNKETDNLKNQKVMDYYALRQYGKAMSMLGKILSVEGDDSLTVAMMSCILFIIFEAMRGDYEMSLNHMQSGLLLLRKAESRNESYGTEDTRRGTGDNRDLVHTLCRLNLGRIAVNPTSAVSTTFPTQDVDRLIKTVPQTLHDLEDLRNWMYSCEEAFFADFFLTFKKQYLGHSEEPQLTSEAYSKLLSQCQVTFNTFVHSNQIGPGHKEFQKATLMELSLKCSKVFFAVGMTHDEMAYDAHIADFDSIVWLVSCLANNYKSTPSLQDGPIFYFDNDIVVMYIFYVVRRCRDPWIRRRALSLLSVRSWRICVWNGEMLRKIGERVILIEENIKRLEDVRVSQCEEVLVRLILKEVKVFSDERKVLVEFVRTECGTSVRRPQHELIEY